MLIATRIWAIRFGRITNLFMTRGWTSRNHLKFRSAVLAFWPRSEALPAFSIYTFKSQILWSRVPFSSTLYNSVCNLIARRHKVRQMYLVHLVCYYFELVDAWGRLRTPEENASSGCERNRTSDRESIWNHIAFSLIKAIKNVNFIVFRIKFEKWTE